MVFTCMPEFSNCSEQNITSRAEKQTFHEPLLNILRAEFQIQLYKLIYRQALLAESLRAHLRLVSQITL